MYTCNKHTLLLIHSYNYIVGSGSGSVEDGDGDFSGATLSAMFESGSVTGDVRCVNVSIINDNFVEFDEVFAVELQTQSGLDRVIGDTDISVTIVDDDGVYCDTKFNGQTLRQKLN